MYNVYLNIICQKRRLFLLVLLAFFTHIGSISATINPEVLSIRFKDSIVSNAKSPTISNNLILKNLTSDTLHLQLTTSIDQGWKLMFPKPVSVLLLPQEKKFIPVTLAKTSDGLTSVWSSVGIHITDIQNSDTTDRRFWIKSQVITAFTVIGKDNKDIIFINKEYTRDVSITLKNEGNMPMGYHITWQLAKFYLKDKAYVSLPPHKDTTITYTIKLNNALVKQFQNDVFQVLVSDDSSKTSSVSYHVFYCTKSLNVYKSAYNTFPLSVELGTSSRANSKYTFGTVNGLIPFNKGRSLSFYYRSEEYNELNSVQTNVFRFTYNNSLWNIYIGQSYQESAFQSYGNELSIKRTFARNSSVTLWAIKPVKTQSTFIENREQAGLNINYQFRKKINITHFFVAAFDSAHQLEAGIINNKVRLIGIKHINIEGNIGLGTDSMRSTKAKSNEADNIGYTAGINLQMNYTRISISGNANKNSLALPGICRGQDNYNFNLSLKASKNISISPFLNANHIINNYGIDTILNSNRINFNMTRYGIRTSYHNNRLSSGLSAGYYENTATSTMPIYQYADFNINYRSQKNLQVSLNTQSGLAKNPLTNKKDLWFNSSNLNFSSRYFQLVGTYFHYPATGNNDPGNINSKAFTETMNLIAGYRFNFFNLVSGNLCYELARYSVNNIITHNASGSISYQGPKNKFNITLQGSIPLQSASGDNATFLYNRNYVQVAIKRSFNVPIFNKKRNFDCRLRLFYDENSNNIKDKDEAYIKDGFVSINNHLFVTGKNGAITYNNIDTGIYTIDYTRIEPKTGYIPARGRIESVTLDKDMQLDIPFKKGRMISGNIFSDFDTLSKIRISLESIKIIVADSSKVIGTTMTNSDGSYSIGVPAGNYKVSLNPEAFNEKMKPVQLTFSVDLINQEKATVNFIIKQKRREMRILQNKPTKESAVTSPEGQKKN